MLCVCVYVCVCRYEIGAILKRTSHIFKSGDVTLKVDDVDNLGMFVQVCVCVRAHSMAACWRQLGTWAVLWHLWNASHVFSVCMCLCVCVCITDPRSRARQGSTARHCSGTRGHIHRT